MPYIPNKERRTVLDPVCEPAQDEGELNFQISRLLNAYIVEHGLKYERLGDATSACFKAATEFDRRVTAPYEAAKCFLNGDVYDRTIFDFIGAMLPF